MPWRAEIINGISTLVAVMSDGDTASSLLGSISDVKKAALALFIALSAGATGGTVFTASVITHYSSLQEVPELVERMDAADAERAAIMQRVDALVCELRIDRLGDIPPECDDRILR